MSDPGSYMDTTYHIEVFVDGDRIDITLPSHVNIPSTAARDLGYALLNAADVAEASP